MIRENAGRARGQAVRAAAAVGPDHRPQRRGRLSGAPARRPAGTSACGAGSTRSIKVPVIDRAARRDRARRRRGRRGDSGRARARARRRLRQLPGRGGVPAQPRRARPPDRVSDGGHVPHQPGAVRGRDAGQRRRATTWRRTICTSTRSRPIASASSRCSTAGRFRRAIWRARSCTGHDSFQRGQAFIDAGGCRGLQEEVLLSGSWNLNPWLVRSSRSR